MGSPGVDWPLGLGTGPAPPLHPSVGPRRSGPRGHGALSSHGRLGDYSPGEPPGPRRRRWWPAFEEVRQTWASPRPGAPHYCHPSISLSPSARHRPAAPAHRDLLSFASRGPAAAQGLSPAQPASPEPRRSTARYACSQPPSFSQSCETAPGPAPQASCPLPRPRRVWLPYERLPSVGPESAPGAPMSALLRGPGDGSTLPPKIGSPICSHPAPPSVRPGSGRPLQRWPAVDTGAEDGPGLQGGWVFQAPGKREGTGKRGGGKEGAGAGWAAGGIPGSAQTGPGAARCEMRLVERPGQRAGGGRRTASASRRPPAPGARRLCLPCLSERPRKALRGHLCWPFCLLADRPFVSLLISVHFSVSLPVSLSLSLM